MDSQKPKLIKHFKVSGKSILGSEAEKKRLTIEVSASLHKRLKVMAVMEERTMAEIIIDALEERLKDE